jgi:ABC-type polysaccharide/polyol phosphate transport system ATPase subunit
MPTAFEPGPFTAPQPDSEPVIRFEDVAVRYRLPREGVSGVKEYAIRLLQRRINYEEFWALRGVSFEVHPGEVFGIIGRNGAGKSTLLKVMARVLQPLRGRGVMRGRITPLLELGGGFHPELTGRENIFLNMALLGFSRTETEALFDQIVDFAEIPDFIEAPLRTYSTGMVARLGFAVGTCVPPEILLVDEVLSVGDALFQQKCLDRMNAYQANGTTIVIVSHSMATLQTFCERAMWLNQGQVEAIGEVDDVIEAYISQGKKASGDQSEAGQAAPDFTALDIDRQVYPTRRIFSPEEGTLSMWVRFTRQNTSQAAMLFHTDDSRYVMYVQELADPGSDQNYYQITARAGGNQRGPDPVSGTFPEITAHFYPKSFLLEEWVHLAMTWKGEPHGRLRLYVNGHKVGERAYGPDFNDSRAPAARLAVGIRPPIWPGERVLQPDGSYREMPVPPPLPAEDMGVDIRFVHLYHKTLSPEEIRALHQQRFETETEPGWHNAA